MKMCTKCRIYKPLHDYYEHKETKRGVHSQCKLCEREYQQSDEGKAANRRWRLENIEYVRAHDRARRKSPRALIKKAQYDRQYRKRPTAINNGRVKKYGKYWKGTQDELLAKYQSLFIEQQGCCAICSTHQSTLVKKLGVDHDHKTGEVRGLLCDFCNRGLGFLKDDAVIVNAAFVYLSRSKFRLVKSDYELPSLP